MEYADEKNRNSKCTHKGSCTQEVGFSFWRNFLRGCSLKLLLRLITERSFKTLIKKYSDIPRFGVVVGLFSSLFKLTKCLLNKYFPQLDERLKTFLSGMMCSLALLFAMPGDQTILKMLIYPRAIECIFQFLSEKGYLSKFKHGDILVYALQVSFITYSYLFEPDNMSRGFNRTIDTYAQPTFSDSQSLFAGKAFTRAVCHNHHTPKTQF